MFLSGHAYQHVLVAPSVVDALCVSVPRLLLDTWGVSPDFEDHRDEPLLVWRQFAVCIPGAHNLAGEAVAHEVTSHASAQDILRPKLPGSHEL